MKLRNKNNGKLASSNRFNPYGMSEIIVAFKDGDMDSDYISNYEVYLESTKSWKDLRQAFKDKDVITDNYNTRFFEPPTKEDKERGYTL